MDTIRAEDLNFSPVVQERERERPQLMNGSNSLIQVNIVNLLLSVVEHESLFWGKYRKLNFETCILK